MKILHYKDEPIYRETFSKKELKDFLGGSGIIWDGNFEPLIETTYDRKDGPEPISVNVADSNFVIYNTEYTLKGLSVLPLPEKKELANELEKHPELKLLVTKSGMFMIYSPDEKFVLDLSANWMERRLINYCDYECGKILRNALLNKERELSQKDLTNEQKEAIVKRYDTLIETSESIVELASKIRMTHGRRGADDEYKDSKKTTTSKR